MPLRFSNSLGVNPYPRWKHKALIQITNPVSIASYQHKLILACLPGMADDFRDIRFAQADRTKCDYWIESYTAGVSATVWIEVPTSGQKYLVLYYGNSQAVSESSGANTFSFFDDFIGALGTSPDSSKWTVSKKGSTSAVVQLDGNGHLQIAGAPNQVSSGNVISISTIQKTPTVGFSLEYREKADNISYLTTTIGTTNTLQGNDGSSTNWWFTVLSTGYGYVVNDTADYQVLTRDPPSANYVQVAKSSSIIPISVNSYYRRAMRYNVSNQLSGYTNNSLSLSGTDSTYSTGNFYIHFGQGEYSNGNGGNRYIDWILIRKLVDTEPVLSLVSHQPNGALMLPYSYAAAGRSFGVVIW
jgi:hypothetical protein